MVIKLMQEVREMQKYTYLSYLQQTVEGSECAQYSPQAINTAEIRKILST